MANLEFVDQHNMVACLEKTGGNSEFHEIVDFLTSSLIHHALTVSPTIYTSYIEQFWNTASSQTINNVKQIDATVDSKEVVVTKASIRSSILFNDADGTACLTNEAIFQNRTLMGYEGDFNKLTFQKALFSPQWKFLIHTILHCLSSKSTSWNEFSTNIPSTVICLAINQKFNFSKLIFAGDQPPETSSSHSTTQESRDSLKETNGNKGIRVLALESIQDAQAVEIRALKSRIKKLEKMWKPSISHHRAWLKTMNRLSMKKRFGKKESVSKQRRKKSKLESNLDDSTVFDDQDADHGMEYIETEEVVDEGSVVKPRTPPTTTSIFDDEDITIAQTLIKMKEEKAKEKGVSIKDVDDSLRPARSILTLKLLPTIDPKDKGKGVFKESPLKKVKRSDLDAAQIAKDAEIARLVHEKELAEMEREREERQRQDQASVDYIASLYDEVQAKMDASEELAARLQMEERERDIHNRIKALYIKEQERDADFVPVGSERDEKMIDKMNKKAAGMDEEEVPEEPESTKVKVKQEGREENIRKRSGRRLKMKAIKKSKRQKTDSDLEEEEQLRASLKIVPDEEEEIDYEVLGMRVHILALEDGTEIHMLVERRYPLIRETLERMMELRLTDESKGKVVLDLLKFIQKQIDEFGGQDRSEKDL
ncbi:hypothetical protein Tco_1014909 [Tanacetum coccineum]